MTLKGKKKTNYQREYMRKRRRKVPLLDPSTSERDAMIKRRYGEPMTQPDAEGQVVPDYNVPWWDRPGVSVMDADGNQDY